jgi:phosphate transport system protein
LPKLAAQAQSQVRKSLDAFVEGDVTQAEEVIQGDELIDATFIKIFNEILAIMMEDSRNIRRGTNLMSIAKHLERIGDHAMNVAEMVIYMVRGTDVRHPRSRALKR